jgi:hypothetical protein
MAVSVSRPYSIAVFGCTGNAGRGVAYHVVKSAILRHSAAQSARSTTTTNTTKLPIRVALAGRSRDKVNKIYESIIEELRQERIINGDDDAALLCDKNS